MRRHSREERDCIAQLFRRSYSQQEIAEALGRNASEISQALNHRCGFALVQFGPLCHVPVYNKYHDVNDNQNNDLNEALHGALPLCENRVLQQRLAKLCEFLCRQSLFIFVSVDKLFIRLVRLRRVRRNRISWSTDLYDVVEPDSQCDDEAQKRSEADGQGVDLLHWSFHREFLGRLKRFANDPVAMEEGLGFGGFRLRNSSRATTGWMGR